MLRSLIAAALALAVMSTPALASNGRPANCPARAWCGCWLANYFGLHDRDLWLARNWAKRGHRVAGPAPGVIGVYRHHVVLVRAVRGRGRILALSGNDGNAVRERERSTRGIIAWVSL